MLDITSRAPTWRAETLPPLTGPVGGEPVCWQAVRPPTATSPADDPMTCRTRRRLGLELMMLTWLPPAGSSSPRHGIFRVAVKDSVTAGTKGTWGGALT